MKKIIGLLSVVLVFAVFYGCGKSPVAVDTSPGSGGGGTTTTVGRITGSAVVSESDLTKLGLTVSTSSLSLLSKVDPLVMAAVVKPSALTSGTATLCTLNDAGAFISTGITTDLASDGTYTFSFTPVAGTLYYVKIVKENAGKMIELFTPIYMPLVSSEVSADSSVTTTLIAMIVSSVVEELKSKSLDPEVIDALKAYLMKTLADMIEAGDIRIPSLVTSSGVDNAEVKKIVAALMDAASTKDMIKSIKLNLMMEKGKASLAGATAFIREVFSIIAGGPDNVPNSAVEALGQAFYEGRTQTVKQVVDAINVSGIDPVTGASKTLSLNADTIASNINTSLTDLYNNLSSKSGTVPPIVLAVFPPAEKTTLLPITKDTVLKIPQVMMIVQKVMDGMGVPFDPFKMMENMGIYTIPSGLQIMHSEMRVVNYHDWGDGAGGGETDTAVLSSFVDLYDKTGPAALAGAQLTLRYPMAVPDGVMSTESYTLETGGGGGKTGVMYKIAPWGAPGDAKMISNFKKSSSGVTCTIIATAGGSTVTKDVTLVYIDLSSAKPTLQVPKATFDPFDITEVAAGVSPVFSWIEPTVSLPSGYVLKYALEVSLPGGGPGVPPTWVYNSWNTQSFIKGNSFTLPSTITLTADQQYFLGIRALAIEESTNRPIAEGPFTGGIFVVKNLTGMSATSETYALTGTITAPASDTKLKVGLFKVNESTFSTGTKIEPVVAGVIAGSSFTINWTPGSLATYKGYGIEVIAWNDEDDDGKALVGGPGAFGEPLSFSRKHIGYWGGTLSVWDETLGKDFPLKGNLTNFNCDLTFGGHRISSVSPAGVKNNFENTMIKMLNNPAPPVFEDR